MIDGKQTGMRRGQRSSMLLTSYSDFKCIISKSIHPLSDVENQTSKVWSASFRLDQDVRFLFPYINAVRDDALCYEKPEHVRFLFEGYRCFLYPDLAAAHFFENKTAAKAFIVNLMDFLNHMDAQKNQIRPNFEKIRQVPVIDILKLLPKTNCRECGFLTCMAFAAAVTKGRTMADKCPHLAWPISETAVYPVLDNNGTLVSSVSLRIDTAGLKSRIQQQNKHIRKLEDALKTKDKDENLENPSQTDAKKDFGLTNREIEVLKLIAQGLTNNEISNVLFISPHTVKSHMINIFNKLNVSDRTQAAVLATHSHLI
jgi:DNA-binding CsgD family transcriptional regulator/ArsR family metal-binding transcriptional regulator